MHTSSLSPQRSFHQLSSTAETSLHFNEYLVSHLELSSDSGGIKMVLFVTSVLLHRVFFQLSQKRWPFFVCWSWKCCIFVNNMPTCTILILDKYLPEEEADWKLSEILKTVGFNLYLPTSFLFLPCPKQILGVTLFAPVFFSSSWIFPIKINTPLQHTYKWPQNPPPPHVSNKMMQVKIVVTYKIGKKVKWPPLILPNEKEAMIEQWLTQRHKR